MGLLWFYSLSLVVSRERSINAFTMLRTHDVTVEKLVETCLILGPLLGVIAKTPSLSFSREWDVWSNRLDVMESPAGKDVSRREHCLDPLPGNRLWIRTGFIMSITLVFGEDCKSWISSWCNLLLLSASEVFSVSLNVGRRESVRHQPPFSTFEFLKLFYL
jgi:hypothetical protein